MWGGAAPEDADDGRHMGHVHDKPLKHRLVGDVLYWPYSTFVRDMRLGLYPQADAALPRSEGRYGEADEQPACAQRTLCLLATAPDTSPALLTRIVHLKHDPYVSLCAASSASAGSAGSAAAVRSDCD
jgi:hypothetical protein